MKIIYHLLLFFLLGIANANAQPPKTYAQTKREQDWKKYQEDYIEATRYNRNTPSNASAGGSDDAARQLADQWRRNAGKRTAAEQRAWEAGEADRQAAQRERERADRLIKAKAEAEAMRYREQRIAREASRSSQMSVATNQFVTIGFNAEESHRFASATVPYADNGYPLFSNEDYRADVTRAAAAKQSFEQKKLTAGFDELANFVRQFRLASLTAMEAWQFLGKRFPEYQEYTEKEELYAMPGLMAVNTNENDVARRDKELMLLRFDLLLQKHPAEAISAQKYFRFNDAPLSRNCRPFPGTDPALGLNTCELYLLTTSTYADQYSWTQFRRDIFAGQSNQAKWRSRSTAYWKKVAELADMPVVEVLERFADLSEGAWRSGSGYWPTKRYQAEEPAELYVNVHAALEALAEEGDLGAMNAWGHYLATRGSSAKERKKGYNLLRLAAERGSMWAVFNLLFSAEVGNKDAPSVKEARGRLEKMLSAPSPQLQYAAASTLLTKLWLSAIDPVHSDLAYSLCIESAARGYRPAKDMLTSLQWMDIGKLPVFDLVPQSGKKYTGLSVSGQETLYRNWNEARQRYDWGGMETTMRKRATHRYVADSQLVILHQPGQGYNYQMAITQMKGPWEPRSFTYRMNLTIIQKKGIVETGVVFRGPQMANPVVIFTISPAEQYYWFGSLDEQNRKKELHPVNKQGFGHSAAIRKPDEDGRSVNELVVERKRDNYYLYINGTLIETIPVAKNMPALNQVAMSGFVAAGDYHIALISDIFLSVEK